MKSVLYHSLSQVLALVNTLLQYLFVVVTIIELTLVRLIFATFFNLSQNSSLALTPFTLVFIILFPFDIQ